MSSWQVYSIFILMWLKYFFLKDNGILSGTEMFSLLSEKHTKQTSNPYCCYIFLLVATVMKKFLAADSCHFITLFFYHVIQYHRKIHTAHSVDLLCSSSELQFVQKINSDDITLTIRWKIWYFSILISIKKQEWEPVVKFH